MKKLLSNSNGFTLIELLLTIVITSIVSTIIYTLFITGLNLYQKIQIEGQIRDEADYIASLILNELTTNQPRYVTELKNKNGVRLHTTGNKIVDMGIIDDSKDTTTIDIYFENNTFYIFKGENDILSVDLEGFVFVMDPKESTEITLDTEEGFCTESPKEIRCTHSTILLNMTIEDKSRSKGSMITMKPLVLKSSFGF